MGTHDKGLQRARSPAPRPLLRTAFARVDRHLFTGFAFDPHAPERHFVVELLLDGLPLRLARADDPMPALAAHGLEAEHHGFSFILRDHELDETRVVEARIANLDIAIGEALRLDEAPWMPEADPLGRGQVDWLGGLRFSGRIGPGQREGIVEVLVDGLAVAKTRALRWTHMTVGGRDPRPLRAFDLHLAEHFADGRVHRVSFLDESGAELSGSPLPFVAFADGLERAIVGRSDLETERLRATLFDRLFPNSLPLRCYESWRQRFPAPPAPPHPGRIGVIGVGDGDRPATLKSLEGRAGTTCAITFLECTDGAFGYAPGALASFLEGEGSDCDTLIFCPAGTRFGPDALDHLAGALHAGAGIHAAYCDLEVVDARGRVSLLALPAFDYERMLEQGYCSRVFATHKADAARATSLGASNLFRLFTALIDAGGSDGSEIAHLPIPAARIDAASLAKGADNLATASREHLAARGTPARVTLPDQGTTALRTPRVRVAREPTRSAITLVLTTRNQGEAVRATIEAASADAREMAATILIVDNESTEAGTLALFDTLAKDHVRVLRASGPYNPARLANIGIRTAQTPLVCLIEGGLERASPGWIAELSSRLHDDAAIAAPLIAHRDGTLRGAGLVLGPGFSAASAFTDHLAGETGYGDMLAVARECSAPSPGCLMMRRDAFLDVGSFDEGAFPRTQHLVDLGLRLRASGRRLIVTPHATLTFSSPPGADVPIAVDDREREALRTRWADALMNDPYYNPALSLDPRPFSALAWPPRDRSPRRRAHPRQTAEPLP